MFLACSVDLSVLASLFINAKDQCCTGDTFIFYSPGFAGSEVM